MATKTLDLNLNDANPPEESPTGALYLSPAAEQDLFLGPAPPSSSIVGGTKDATVVGSSVRFGVSGVVTAGLLAGNADVQKKIRRAERFGVPVQLSEDEKRNSRAERFGTASTMRGSDSSKKAEELKRKARAERFGIAVPPEPADEEAKKKARLARFAPPPKTNAVEEDKRKARALRFSEASSSSLPPKTAIAGRASGVA